MWKEQDRACWFGQSQGVGRWKKNAPGSGEKVEWLGKEPRKDQKDLETDNQTKVAEEAPHWAMPS
jgi:hypothetical protein